jgi:hypothetical protein
MTCSNGGGSSCSNGGSAASKDGLITVNTSPFKLRIARW